MEGVHVPGVHVLYFPYWRWVGGGGANMRTAGRANHNCRDKVYYYGFHR